MGVFPPHPGLLGNYSTLLHRSSYFEVEEMFFSNVSSFVLFAGIYLIQMELKSVAGLLDRLVGLLPSAPITYISTLPSRLV